MRGWGENLERCAKRAGAGVSSYVRGGSTAARDAPVGEALRFGCVAYATVKESLHSPLASTLTWGMSGLPIVGMATVWPLTRGTARGFFAGAVACLLFLQALGFVFSSNGRIAFASGAVGSSIIMADEICHAAPDGGKAPAPLSHHHHCALCAIGKHHQAAYAVAILASVIVALAPRSNDAPARFVHDDLAPSPLGWTSSWSSRAPPPLG